MLHRIRSAVLTRLAPNGEALGLLLTALVAAALRFYRLEDLPPGLHYDEAFNGVNARALLAGTPPPLLSGSNMGQEPMIFYLVAAAFALAGQAAWVIRLPSAVVGLLTVPASWWLGRELCQGDGWPSSRSRALGLGTALVLAILYWHVSFSRIGMEPILVPLFAVVAMAGLMHGLNSGRWPGFVVAGLGLGGSLYTYKAGYFVPVLAFLFVAYAIAVQRGLLRTHGRRLALTALVFLAVAAPLGVFAIRHPSTFWWRPTQVVVSPEAGSAGSGAGREQGLLGGVVRTLGMFFVRGDANPRSNLPGRPALDPYLAVLFVLGLGRALVEAGRRRLGAGLAVIWLVVMTVPTVITEYPPHFARAIGATPAVAFLCALGGWTVWQGGLWLAGSRSKRVPAAAAQPDTAMAVATQHVGARGRAVMLAVSVLLAGGVTYSAISTARAYFVAWGNSPDLFYAWDVGLVRLADTFNALPSGEAAYLTPTDRQHFTLQFLLSHPLASFDGREGGVFPPVHRPAAVAILLQEDDVTLPRLKSVRPEGSVVAEVLDSWGRPYAAVYRLPARPSTAEKQGWPSPEHGADASFGGVVRLLGYSVSPGSVAPGGQVTLTLVWQSLMPMPQDYTVFTHLLGPYNAATRGPMWAGHDGQPDGGHYPTTAWQPGEVILDQHRWSIPDDAPPGEYSIEVGLYLRATMERLPAVTAGGRSLPDNAAIVGTLRVESASP